MQEKFNKCLQSNDNPFLVDFSFVLGIFVKTTCAELSSFFSALNTAHSFSNSRKIFGKKAASKPQAREFFLCFVVKFFNSTETFHS